MTQFPIIDGAKYDHLGKRGPMKVARPGFGAEYFHKLGLAWVADSDAGKKTKISDYLDAKHPQYDTNKKALKRAVRTIRPSFVFRR